MSSAFLVTYLGWVLRIQQGQQGQQGPLRPLTRDTAGERRRKVLHITYALCICLSVCKVSGLVLHDLPPDFSCTTAAAGTPFHHRRVIIPGCAVIPPNIQVQRYSCMYVCVCVCVCVCAYHQSDILRKERTHVSGSGHMQRRRGSKKSNIKLYA
jgi:hypothetical protein